MVGGSVPDEAGEWWGLTERQVAPEDLGGSITGAGRQRLGTFSSKELVDQRNGERVRTEVAWNKAKYEERRSKPPRKRRKTKCEPGWEPATHVREVIAWLDQREIDPSISLPVVRLPAGTKGLTDHPRDIVTAQEIRRLRKLFLANESDDLAAIPDTCHVPGCGGPVDYKTPASSCRPCWRYHNDTGEWPDTDIINKRQARALKKQRGTHE
jgi:hypothetical protein